MRLQSKNPRTDLPISPKTVKDVDLSALKSVFGWGADNLHLHSNPAAGVELKLGKAMKGRPKGYSDDEAILILPAANAYRRTGRELETTAAAKRWAPWLCAFTGDRVSEVLQLRREDVRREGVPWVAKITPEAGSVKNKEFRDVPCTHSLLRRAS
jgi:integrase